ncbi:hypothetical protein M422DRAFT_277213 [Sphaerobolus stellatus SS14]|uniref:LYC1 C-terminal domain-containing protein n=1 Tax=Sphaerobolus stellatus (strain SS14) TaxID=990650 RepID=A0A0C9U0A5_SPHS4|nr:hypothetical protein M422DRAFT_277213 [Sphaerobolus stellatus SS14]
MRAVPQTFRFVLSAIMQAAKENECGSIEIWNLDSQLEAEAAKLGGKNALRQEHLPSLAWYGPEDSEVVRFLFNERVFSMELPEFLVCDYVEFSEFWYYVFARDK